MFLNFDFIYFSNKKVFLVGVTQKRISHLTYMAYKILLESEYFYTGLMIGFQNWALSEVHLPVGEYKCTQLSVEI